MNLNLARTEKRFRFGALHISTFCYCVVINHLRIMYHVHIRTIRSCAAGCGGAGSRRLHSSDRSLCRWFQQGAACPSGEERRRCRMHSGGGVISAEARLSSVLRVHTDEAWGDALPARSGERSTRQVSFENEAQNIGSSNCDGIMGAETKHEGENGFSCKIWPISSRGFFTRPRKDLYRCRFPP